MNEYIILNNIYLFLTSHYILSICVFVVSILLLTISMSRKFHFCNLYIEFRCSDVGVLRNGMFMLLRNGIFMLLVIENPLMIEKITHFSKNWILLFLFFKNYYKSTFLLKTDAKIFYWHKKFCSLLIPHLLFIELEHNELVINVHDFSSSKNLINTKFNSNRIKKAKNKPEFIDKRMHNIHTYILNVQSSIINTKTIAAFLLEIR